jgi:hypothetical protein
VFSSIQDPSRLFERDSGLSFTTVVFGDVSGGVLLVLNRGDDWDEEFKRSREGFNELTNAGVKEVVT